MPFWFRRIFFALRYRTLRLVILHPSDAKKILVCSGDGVGEYPRRCPHQGAPMEDAVLRGDTLICPWHGCYYDLKTHRFHAKHFPNE